MIEQTNTKRQHQQLPIIVIDLSTVQHFLPSMYLHFIFIKSRVKINHFTDFTDYVRPSEKSQRKELRKVLQHEFRGMLQKRMAVLLQVSKHKFT